MATSTAETVICGAGIAGIAAAYYLAVTQGMADVVLVEQGAPLSLTSDKSTECYRDWWPGPGDAMVALMSRSIDLLEQIAHETGNRIQMNRRGYLYATADPARIPLLRQAAEEAAKLGTGPLRVHGPPADHQPPTTNEELTDSRRSSFVIRRSSYIPAPAHGFAGQPDGADLITDPVLVRELFPYLTEKTVAVLHPRRCGWFSAQQLGMYLLEQAREHGVRMLRGEVIGVDTVGGRVRGVQVTTQRGTSTIATPRFVNAAGPLLPSVGRMLGLELPVFSERHMKISFNDHLRVVPRDAPLLIWLDEVILPWSQEELEALAADDETHWLLGTFPAGVHCRPEGQGANTSLLLLWNYDLAPVEPTFPVAVEEYYPELALRGMAVMIPGLAKYFDRAPKPYIDGGYYTKTRENRPLIGPLPVEGAYVIGALSGYGLMAACAAGELLAAQVTAAPLPRYAPAFLLARYNDPAYRTLLENWGDVGQL